MILTPAERAAHKTLMANRRKILDRLGGLPEAYPVDPELPKEIEAISRLLKPTRPRNRYFALFNAMSYTIQCLGFVKACRREYTELCSDIEKVEGILFYAQVTAEDAYIDAPA